MTSVHNSSGLVLHQMTSDHNRSELRIHDHSNEPSSSKLVPKVVPLAVKTATSRQELELLFHHHIAMLRTTVWEMKHETQDRHQTKRTTFQVVLDALALTPFYRAFLITADVPAIYMQEFWATILVHKSSIRFMINKKKVSLGVDMFREIRQFFPKIIGQKFEDLLLEHDILSFIRDLGHTRDITYLTDVNVDYLHQPWRAFATVINKCLSGKETGMDKIRLSRAQILWGMFHKKNIDYVYLLWEDLLFQIENKDSKKTNKMLYPRFTKIIIDYFMSKDQSILRRNKMFWHTARDDTMFTSMRCISRHEDTQVYEKALKPKLKTSAKVAKSDKKKQPAKMPKAKGDGVDTRSKVPDEQQQKVSGINEGAGVTPEVPDVPKYDSESEEESWTFSQDDEDVEEVSDKNDDSKETESNNDGDDLTHPNLLTYKSKDQEEEKANEEEEDEEKADNKEVSSEQKVSTPPDYEITEEEENKEDDDKDKESEQEEEEDELYGDLNINVEKSDAKMTDAQANQDTEDTHVTLTTMPPVVQQQSSSVSSDLVSRFINPSPDTGIDSILNQDTQSHTLVNVLVSVAAETPSSVTTIPQPPIPNI
ncbi:hypothetical protein Tco_1001556 [Tanacetum coccineum]